jgi:hypothetical protein
MEILENYLKAVRRNLPWSQRNDIIRELSEDLRSQMEDKGAELGRPLTEDEQIAFLKQHGDPMTVARRYRQNLPSLSIGWELIGPELFPMYRIILGLNLAVMIPSIIIISLLVHAPITLSVFVVPVLVQFVVVTVVFILLNLVKRKYPQPWYYPPAELATMIPISRGYSIAGLAMWAVVALWWLLLPRFPALILGSGAGHLQLSPSWHRFYVPVLLLVLASMMQRVINLIRPRMIWVLPVTRLLINAAAVPVLYFLVFKSQPLVVVADGPNALAQYGKLAEASNGFVVWGVLGPWVWIYAGVSAIVYAWYCRPHLRRWLRRRNEPALSRTS